MNVKLILTDDDGNIIALGHIETDVVDAHGNVLTSEALANAIKSGHDTQSITWKHDDSYRTSFDK